jgi:uncharacterized membrane protein
MSHPLRWRGHEVSRIEGFSDTVFAFALTLLVVSLEVPRTFPELMQGIYGFLPFTCSFALLIWIWHEHNQFFRRYGMQDNYTVLLNAAVLFVVLFYVYPLKFVFTLMFGAFGLAERMHMPNPELPVSGLQTLFALYGIGFVVLFCLFALLYRHAYQHRAELGLDELQAFDAKAGSRQHLVSVMVGLCSTIVALTVPGRAAAFAGFVYMFMGPAHALQGWRTGKKRRVLEARLARTSAS